MSGQVPVLSVIFMILSLIGAFALPFALAVYFRKKYRCEVIPFFTGCVVMLVFAFILEQIAHSVILAAFPGLQSRSLLFALYAGLMAGLFEETGRLAAFQTVLRKFQHNDHNALMYGAGHGGFEAVAILGIAMVNNLIFAFMMNSGNASLIPTEALNAEQVSALEDAMATLASSPSYVFLLGLVERIAAIVLHISFSVLVWSAAKYRKKVRFILAIALHMLVDAVTVLLSTGGMPPVLLEIVILLMSAGCAFLSRNLTQNVSFVTQERQDG